VYQYAEPLAPSRRLSLRPSLIFLLIAALAFAVPTLIGIAHASWATEQGGHGPMVLAVAIWLIVRDRAAVQALARPGSATITALLLVPLLIVYVFARITSIIEIEALAMYGALLVVAYGFVGLSAMIRLWFPLLFLLFAVPPPDTLYALLTQPLKIAISDWSVDLLYALGYPVASSGVILQIGQYQLLVAAACSGVNSLLSLTALGLFYSYIRHGSHPVQMSILVLFTVPIAIAVNLVRVLMLMLITYYFGEAAGQGWFHEFAGLSMFVVALAMVYAVDETVGAIRRRVSSKAVA
jgi:exosortase